MLFQRFQGICLWIRVLLIMPIKIKHFLLVQGKQFPNLLQLLFRLNLLEINKGDKILEIGTGSGYQAAVLCEMGAKVFTIERIRELYRKTSAFLPSINYFPKKMIYGDGYQGYEKEEPFDGIIVTAGASKIPEKLLLQLKIGGRMVIPVGENTRKWSFI